MLHGLFNKESLFYSHMLALSDKDLVVSLNKYQKDRIVRDIGSKSKNPSAIAKQYINRIVKAGLMIPLGGGSYKINPSINGFSAGSDYLERHRQDYAEISIALRSNGDTKISTSTGEILKDDDGKEYVLTNDGKKKFI